MAASQELALSKNVLAMKFMQRSRAKAKCEPTEIPELQTAEKWKYDITAETSGVRPSVPVVRKVSLSACRLFDYGRVSYQGFNEEVEKVMRMKRKYKPDGDEGNGVAEVSVSDEAMASSLARTIGGKFSKNKRGKKRQFEENEEHNQQVDDEEDEDLNRSDEAALRIAEIKRRVHELLGEDD